MVKPCLKQQMSCATTTILGNKVLELMLCKLQDILQLPLTEKNIDLQELQHGLMLTIFNHTLN